MDYRETYESWLNSSRLDPALREELLQIRDDPREIEERFYRDLDFGTAGLRGILGAGTNRMNVPVVRRATRGLAEYLLSVDGARERGVAIAYDSRRFSEAFARETAQTLAAMGVRAYLYATLHSVPQLSFSIRHLNCIAGVVVTASHNPPQYNGYKVYWEHGGQISPEQAEQVTACIRRQEPLCPPGMPLKEAVAAGMVTMIGEEVDEAYYAATSALLLHPDLDRRKGHSLKLVYTPLHGAGNVPVRALLERAGFSNVSVVKEQELPDGAFPTVKAPNPEDPAAFTLAFWLADQIGADACIATDPDADRLGLAVRRGDGAFEMLTGNQIGCLLLYYLLDQKQAAGTLPKDGLVVRSLVSTRLADAICKDYGVKLETVLTGFRFISGIIDECEKTGRNTFLFGFEESYGFLAGTVSRDKDAICAAVLAAEAALFYGEQGKTLYDVLGEIYRRYGYYKERVVSYSLSGKTGMERISAAMASLREQPLEGVAGVAVEAATDYISRKRTLLGTGRTEPVSLPRSNVLQYDLADGSWLCVRPSGTEPKLKLYIGAREETESGADTGLNGLFTEMNAKLNGLLQQ